MDINPKYVLFLLLIFFFFWFVLDITTVLLSVHITIVNIMHADLAVTGSFWRCVLLLLFCFPVLNGQPGTRLYGEEGLPVHV